MRLVFAYWLFILFLFISSQTFSQEVVECPAKQLDVSKVDFMAIDCKTSTLQDYIMSEKSVWVSVSYPVGNNLLTGTKPVGLFISGHVSANIYVNEVRLGAKGKASLQYDTEIPGAFDWVGYVPERVLNNTSNQIVMHLSSFHTYRAGLHPFNKLYFDQYQSPTQKQLQHYWPTLVPLGAMLLSLIYLFRRLFLEPKNFNVFCLVVMTLAATLQLIAEISRGLYAYSYPLHDVRLSVIVFCAFVFGQALFIQVLNQFTKVNIKSAVAFCVAIILIPLFLMDDLDLKATAIIQVPALLAAWLIAFECYRSKEKKYIPSLILFAFAVIIIIAPNNFLDVYLYYCIAALLAYLLSREALNKVSQQKELILEKQRAEKLQLVVDLKATEKTFHTIALKDSSQIIMLKVEDILFCKGAGDYVEVYLPDRSILHSGSLSSIVEELPSYFMKVHRSYIVNAKHIALMRRLPGGTGEIELSSGHNIPVSRRLLPKLKGAFEGC
jgi:hypothetical protein